MTPDETPGAGVPRQPSRRPWPISNAPRIAVLYLVLVEAMALVWVVGVARDAEFSRSAALRVLLLIGFAVVFEEASRRAGRMRILLSNYLQPDMTSVWSFAAAMALPAPYAIGMSALLMVNLWFRIWRPAGGLLYRKVEAAATVFLACLASAVVRQVVQSHLTHAPTVVAEAVAVIVALVVYSAVNRGLVTVAIVLEGGKLRELGGTWDDNLLEVATLCLGGLVAVTIGYEPALTALVLLPMVLLQRGALVRQLEVAATTDSKTGLLNAIAWEQLAQRDLSRAQREGRAMSVLIIDVDRFKWVNDMHGHLTGDVALKAIGDALTQELRGYDTVGRFGGEEFVASLPNADDAAALAVAERIRIRVNRIRIADLVQLKDPDSDRLLAVSIGVACSPADGTELTELLHAADAALYVAKESGRNRVELAQRGTGGAPDFVTVS